MKKRTDIKNEKQALARLKIIAKLVKKTQYFISSK